mmetsp:Transcript_20128/g.17249  ORF Transcript_20128/g.17249 Transcript_20128/m.17249 type:complete len:267 (+) Transcript_20128:907-1707(+)
MVKLLDLFIVIALKLIQFIKSQSLLLEVSQHVFNLFLEVLVLSGGLVVISIKLLMVLLEVLQHLFKVGNGFRLDLKFSSELFGFSLFILILRFKSSNQIHEISNSLVEGFDIHLGFINSLLLFRNIRVSLLEDHEKFSVIALDLADNFLVLVSFFLDLLFLIVEILEGRLGFLKLTAHLSTILLLFLDLLTQFQNIEISCLLVNLEIIDFLLQQGFLGLKLLDAEFNFDRFLSPFVIEVLDLGFKVMVAAAKLLILFIKVLIFNLS